MWSVKRIHIPRAQNVRYKSQQRCPSLHCHVLPHSLDNKVKLITADGLNKWIHSFRTIFISLRKHNQYFKLVLVKARLLLKLTIQFYNPRIFSVHNVLCKLCKSDCEKPKHMWDNPLWELLLQHIMCKCFGRCFFFI